MSLEQKQVKRKLNKKHANSKYIEGSEITGVKKNKNMILSFQKFNEHHGPSSNYIRDQKVSNIVELFIDLISNNSDVQDTIIKINSYGFDIPTINNEKELDVLIELIDNDPTLSVENDDLFNMNFHEFQKILNNVIEEFKTKLLLLRSEKLQNVNKQTEIFNENIDDIVISEDDDFILLKVSMIILSHVSDIQEIGIGTQHRDSSIVKEFNQKINFIKYLILTYPNTNVEINPNRVWNQFLKKHPQYFEDQLDQNEDIEKMKKFIQKEVEAGALPGIPQDMGQGVDLVDCEFDEIDEDGVYVFTISGTSEREDDDEDNPYEWSGTVSIKKVNKNKFEVDSADIEED